MAEQKIGIDNLKKFVHFGLDLAEQIAKTTGKKWNFLMALDFVDEVAAIPGVVKSWPAVLTEIKDLDDDERKQLHEYVQEEFDIPNERVEEVVEDSLVLVISMVNLVTKFKNKNSTGDTQSGPGNIQQ